VLRADKRFAVRHEKIEIKQAATKSNEDRQKVKESQADERWR
jgi:hypothetical protein